jgi:hypothetical protein
MPSRNKEVRRTTLRLCRGAWPTAVSPSQQLPKPRKVLLAVGGDDLVEVLPLAVVAPAREAEVGAADSRTQRHSVCLDLASI